MQISDRLYQKRLHDNTLRIAVVTSLFNHKITLALEQGAINELEALGVDLSRITVWHVPGAWELPLATSKIFRGNYADAVIACGCVIRGETGHYDIVAQQSAAGLMRVALDYARPVINAVLTVENWAQAEARSVAGPSNKGAEAARALVELCNTFYEAR